MGSAVNPFMQAFTQARNAAAGPSFEQSWARQIQEPNLNEKVRPEEINQLTAPVAILEKVFGTLQQKNYEAFQLSNQKDQEDKQRMGVTYEYIRNNPNLTQTAKDRAFQMLASTAGKMGLQDLKKLPKDADEKQTTGGRIKAGLKDVFTKMAGADYPRHGKVNVDEVLGQIHSMTLDEQSQVSTQQRIALDRWNAAIEAAAKDRGGDVNTVLPKDVVQKFQSTGAWQNLEREIGTEAASKWVMTQMELLPNKGDAVNRYVMQRLSSGRILSGAPPQGQAQPAPGTAEAPPGAAPVASTQAPPAAQGSAPEAKSPSAGYVVLPHRPGIDMEGFIEKEITKADRPKGYLIDKFRRFEPVPVEVGNMDGSYYLMGTMTRVAPNKDVYFDKTLPAMNPQLVSSQAPGQPVPYLYQVSGVASQPVEAPGGGQLPGVIYGSPQIIQTEQGPRIVTPASAVGQIPYIRPYRSGSLNPATGMATVRQIQKDYAANKQNINKWAETAINRISADIMSQVDQKKAQEDIAKIRQRATDWLRDNENTFAAAASDAKRILGVDITKPGAIQAAPPNPKVIEQHKKTRAAEMGI